jgi:endoglycosylceramidase
VVKYALAAADAQHLPLVATEYGATTDPVPLDRMATGFDDASIPWINWTYDQTVIARQQDPAGLDNLNGPEGFRALVRPHPTAIAGTPTATHFDLASSVYTLEYSTAAPSGRRLFPLLATTISVPSLRYPDGYRVEVEGARVVSGPCAPTLELLARPSAAQVSVVVRPDHTGCHA